jgi:NADPH2:quinone reductase
MTRAVRFDRYGGVDVLYVGDVGKLAPGAGEVLVEVRAAGINPGEAAIRQGYMDAMAPSTFPSGQGSDLAGVVAAVGEGVDAWSVGDEVLGWSWTRSSQAEAAVVPAGQLVAKPAGLDWNVAGALYVVGATAYAAVRAVAAGPGDTVVQLLAVRGATVIGIASEANHGWLSGLGVTPVAYGDGLAERITAAAPDGVDAFIDLFGPEYLHLAVELGVARDRIETIISFEAAAELGAHAEGSVQATTTEVLAEMAGLVAAGRIDVPIAAVYPLDEVRAAFTELEKRHTRGKIVLVP